jgi:hypothetical protein
MNLERVLRSLTTKSLIKVMSKIVYIKRVANGPKSELYSTSPFKGTQPCDLHTAPCGVLDCRSSS